MKRIFYSLFLLLCAYHEAKAQNCTPPPVGCTNTDLTNTFLFSEDPNTIEYDNIVSGYHQSGARLSNGTFRVWGEIAGHNAASVYYPTEINATNYPGLTGTILKFTMGVLGMNSEFVILTTTGLFSWGAASIFGPLIKIPGTNPATTFTKITVQGKTDGLPPGVTPADVKMMFGTSLSLVITTCNGSVWIISQKSTLNGNGTPTGPNTGSSWHQVKTDEPGHPYLKDVVATRGGFATMMALTRHGEIYTWGEIYKGDNTPDTVSLYATKMTIPIGITPKMIGISGFNPTYFLLTTKGEVYSLGSNNYYLLGIYTTAASSNKWLKVQQSPTEYMKDIVWISPSEHVEYVNGMNVLTKSGKRYTWGSNAHGMLGIPENIFASHPTNYINVTAANKIITGIETGGHTSIMLTQCDTAFGYAGHYIGGSAGNTFVGNVDSYMFQTAKVRLCGGNNSSAYIERTDTPACIGSTYVLKGYPSNGKFYLLTNNAVFNNNQLTITGGGEVKITFHDTIDKFCGVEPDILTLYPVDYGNLPNIKARATIWDNNKIWLGTLPNAQPTAECSTQLNDSIGGAALFANNVQVTGKGSFNNRMAILANKPYELRLTIGSNQASSRYAYYAVFIDVDGNEKFDDSVDLFFNGKTLIAAQSNGTINIPVNFLAPAAQPLPAKAHIRVVATARNLNWDKSMNGKFEVVNGEVEDYFLTYTGVNNINGVSNNNHINFYPNPANDILHLVGLQKNDIMILYSMDGRKLLEQNSTGEAHNLSLAHLSDGVYWLNILRDHHIVFRTKIVKAE